MSYKHWMDKAFEIIKSYEGEFASMTLAEQREAASEYASHLDGKMHEVDIDDLAEALVEVADEMRVAACEYHQEQKYGRDD